MIVPFKSSNGQVQDLAIMINKIGEEDDGKFSIQNNFLTTSTFQNLYTNCLHHAELKLNYLGIKNIQGNVLGLLDLVFAQFSMSNYVKSIEQQFPKIFNCERATLVLVNRQKQYLYRIIKDQAGVDDIKKYTF